MKFLFTVVVVLLAPALARGQFTNTLDHATNIVIDADWFTDEITVGSTSSMSRLTIRNGWTVGASDLIVGAGGAASNNMVDVVGARTRLIMTNGIVIGTGTGTNNSVRVGNGGRVETRELDVADGNTLAIFDNGTFAIDNDLDLQEQSNLNWRAGGHLELTGALTGLRVESNGTFLAQRRDLTLNGGSFNTASNTLQMGLGNVLTVTNGGLFTAGGISTNQVAASEGVIIGSTNGMVFRLGDGAELMTTGLYAGSTDGLYTAAVLITNNAVLRTDALSVETGSELNIDRRGRLVLTGDYNFDAQTNIHWNSGGILQVEGELTKADDRVDGTDRTLVIATSNGAWNVAGDLTIAETNSTLLLAGGASVTAQTARVGVSTNDMNAQLEVSGAHSVLKVNKMLVGTSKSTGHAASVAHGGRIELDELTVAVSNSFNLNNGGTLAFTGNLDVSAQDNLNWARGGNLAVSGILSGMTTSNLLFAGETNSAAVLDGGRNLTLEGGQWLLGETNLVVGFEASGSALTVTNGGTPTSADAYIGWNGSRNNETRVTGAGSTWTNRGSLFIGMQWNGTNLVARGSGNRVIVEDGGLVIVGDGLAGMADVASNGMIVAAASNSHSSGRVEVGGGALAVNALMIGIDSNRTGTVTVHNGGTVATESLEIQKGSELNLQRGATFNITNDFDVADRVTNGLNWGEGSTLGVGGVLTGMETRMTNGMDYAVLDGERDLALFGTNGVWGDSATNGLIIGVNSSNSVLALLDGARMTNAQIIAGFGSNSVNNGVLIRGSNTALEVTGDITLNSDNGIRLEEDGTIRIGGDMNLHSNSFVFGTGTNVFSDANGKLVLDGNGIGIGRDVVFQGMGSNGVVVNAGTFMVNGSISNQYLGFEALDINDSTLAGEGAIYSDVFATVSITNGVINPFGQRSPYAVLRIEGDLDLQGESRYSAQIGQESHDLLVVDDPEGMDLGNLHLDLHIFGSPVNTNIPILIVTNGSFSGTFASTNLTEDLLLYDSQVIVDLAAGGVYGRTEADRTVGSTFEYAGIESVRSGFRNMKNTVFSRSRQLRRNLVSSNYTATPQEEDIVVGRHIWAQYFNGRSTYDAVDGSRGFDLNHYGTIIGLDRMRTDELVIGHLYTYLRGSADIESGGSLTSESHWIGSYAEWISLQGLYSEVLLSLGRVNYTSTRVIEDRILEGSYDGDTLALSLDVGQYFYYGNQLFAPYIGLQAINVSVGEHNETTADGKILRVDDIDYSALEASIGFKGRTRMKTIFGRVQASAFIEYNRGLLSQDIAATLEELGHPAVTMREVSPEANFLEGGVGISWNRSPFMEIGVGANVRQGEHYSDFTGSLMLDILF